MNNLPEKEASCSAQCRMKNGVCWGILLEKDDVYDKPAHFEAQVVDR